MCRLMYVICLIGSSALWWGCGSSSETEADRVGVGAECTESQECESDDEDVTLECLTQFAGGYCGLADCEGDADCPEGSACVRHDDGDGAANYCFRLCADKPECNRRRSPDNESNCSSNVEFVDGKHERKACVPPSSGV